MHALFVVPRFFPYRGGYENSILALSRHLLGRGHQVTVFTTTANDLEAFWSPGFKTFSPGEEHVDDVAVQRFPIDYQLWRRRAGRLLGYLPDWRLQAQFRRPSFRVLGLEQALAGINPDLIHIGPLPYTGLMYAGLHTARARGIPVVATPCTHLSQNVSETDSPLQAHETALLDRCDLLACMTETELRQLQQAGVKAEKKVLPYGFELQSSTGGDPTYLQRRYGLDGPVVLHLGMKAFEKGSVTLLEAMRILWRRGSNAWLVMAGPSLSAFEQSVAASAKDFPRLLNLPPFPDGEKRNLLASATIVAQPSRVESLGLVLLEAWANAKPAIAADIPVSRELMTRSSAGLLVPFGHAEALADELEKLLADPQVQQAMGAAGQKFAAEYEGNRTWQRIADEFERLAAARSNGPWS